MSKFRLKKESEARCSFLANIDLPSGVVQGFGALRCRSSIAMPVGLYTPYVYFQ
ncbi:hypothetical protein H6G54_27195 [Anabaena cylindrica FACHB-243]|uniref:hypothetical protein n=1 Tax=Anabaena TaxID=1163 RepID=UPI001493F3C0|nr:MULTISPECIES: hypothetical protein [Anabaena]MBD2421299.1 hypothetical protein [Anabaena cylindrica FACHB-243]MBY5280869.1 hypothetical protein [Anabaena sp. CCAP 1446/1C]MCM2406631.1 hypothetical protein [Anabaena sp. CCAP 1446/1C]